MGEWGTRLALVSVVAVAACGAERSPDDATGALGPSGGASSGGASSSASSSGGAAPGSDGGVVDAGDASSGSSGEGGAACTWAPLIDPSSRVWCTTAAPRVDLFAPAEWPRCPATVDAYVATFTLSSPRWATLDIGEALSGKDGQQILSEGCDGKGARIVTAPADMHLRSVLLNPGSYTLARCGYGSQGVTLVKSPPPPTNTTCATSLAMPSNAIGETAPAYDTAPRYYTFSIPIDSVIPRTLTLVSNYKAGYFTIEVHAGCTDPPTVLATIDGHTGPSRMDIGAAAFTRDYTLPALKAGSYRLVIKDRELGLQLTKLAVF